MHRPRSPRTARAMKLGALTYLLLVFVTIGTVGLISFAFYTENRPLVLSCLGLLALCLILFIFYRIFAASAHCPLCRCPVLAGSGAQRNRKARRLCGSYRFRVARDLMLKNSFVCPYCSESTICQVRERPQPLPQSDPQQRRKKRRSGSGSGTDY